MNDTKITPKKVLLGAVFVIGFVFLYSYFSALTQTHMSQGVLGRDALMMMPTSGYGEGGFGGGRIEMNKMAMVANEGIPPYEVAVDYAPLPTPNPTAPAGVSKIIKNGDLALLVDNIDEVALQITAIRQRLLGQQGNESFSQYTGGGRHGDITLWVPSEKFDEAMLAIKKLALRVDNESVFVQDVSAQYTDLASRLKNLKAAEQQYLVILKQSGKISEVLEVTRALNDTRAQIEQSQGQMDYLSRQVALSSIHVSLTEEANAGAVANEWRPLTVFKLALKGTLTDLTRAVDMFIIVLVKLPVLLLTLLFWGLIVWLCYRGGRALYRRLSPAFFAKKDGV